MQHRMFGERTGLGAGPDEAARIFNSYAEAGGNFIDSPEAYQLGQAGSLIGELTASRRDEFVIASKYSRSASAHPSSTALGNNRKAMAKSVEDSLRRLRTDRIDIYLPHFDDGITPVEEIVRGLDDLVRAGKVLYAGFSNFPAWRVGVAATLADLRGWVPVAVLQLEYNLIERTAEREFLPMAAALGLGVMAYSPLAGGVLTGKYRMGEPGRKGNAPEMDATSNAVIDTLLVVSGQIGCGPGAVAIAWLVRKGMVPILGPRTQAQLLDNLAGATVELDDAHVQQLDDASGIALGQPYDLLAAQRRQLGLVSARTGQVA